MNLWERYYSLSCRVSARADTPHCSTTPISAYKTHVLLPLFIIFDVKTSDFHTLRESKGVHPAHTVVRTTERLSCCCWQSNSQSHRMAVEEVVPVSGSKEAKPDSLIRAPNRHKSRCPPFPSPFSTSITVSFVVRRLKKKKRQWFEQNSSWLD